MDTVNDVICLILLFGIVKLIKIKKNVTIDVSDQSKFNQILNLLCLGRKRLVDQLLVDTLSMNMQ